MIPVVTSLPSGAKLTLAIADFDQSMALMEAIAAELTKVKTGMKFELNLSNPAEAIANFMTGDMPIDILKDGLCQLLASPGVKAHLYECMVSCLYAGVKTEKACFEPAIARQDFLPVAWEVIKLNVLPFFDGLKSKSPRPAAPTGLPPK